MTTFAERHNLFQGALRVAPPPLIPEEWEVSPDRPPVWGFYVHDSTGKAALRPRGEGWQYRTTLRHWHTRQALRVWIGRRLAKRHDRDEAEHRIRTLQMQLKREVNGPNSYLDLLLAIAFEAYYLDWLRSEPTDSAAEVRERAREDARRWREQARSLEPISAAAAGRARAAATALEELAEDGDLAVRRERLPQPDDAGDQLPDEVSGLPREPRRRVWKWVDYEMPSSRYRNAGIHWLLARAILRHRDSVHGYGPSPDYMEQLDESTQRVFRFLELLDAVPQASPRG